MTLRLLVGIVALSTAASAAAAPAVFFDRSSVAPQGGTPEGRGERVLAVQVLGPRLGGRAMPLPLAWSAAGERVEMDEALSDQLRGGLVGLEPSARLADRLASRAAEAGEELPLLEAPRLSALLEHQPEPTDEASGLRTALVRLLTRGNVRDKWSVLPEISSPQPESIAIQLPARRLLQVDIVSFGFHLGSDDASLPPRLAHVGLRARLWNLPEGRREWDRALLVGSTVPEEGDDGGSFRASAERLLDDAADRLAATLWPELGLDFDEAERVAELLDAAPTLSPAGEAAEVEPVSVARDSQATSVDTLLRRLAASRLSSVPEGDPWFVLAQAVKPNLPTGLGLALACAEDPLGAAVQVGTTRLGLGLADTYRRLEQSPAFRKALAADMLDQVIQSSGDDWPLERAVRYLLGDLLEQPALARDAPSVAGPLLQRARLDGARSAEGLASLLIGLAVWPEGGRAMLEELSTP